MVKVVSIAIIKIYVGISAIESSVKIKKVVACRFEPPTRCQWDRNYSAGPAPATYDQKKVRNALLMAPYVAARPDDC